MLDAAVMKRSAAVKAKHLWGVLLDWLGDLVAKIVFPEFYYLGKYHIRTIVGKSRGCVDFKLLLTIASQ